MLPGLAAGFLAAMAVTFREYRSFSEFTGAFMEYSMKAREMQKSVGDGKGTEIQGLFAQALKRSHSVNRGAGEQWLREYGYHPWGRLGGNILYLSVIGVLLSEVIGFYIFWKRNQERRKKELRIEELTEYLLAADRERQEHCGGRKMSFPIWKMRYIKL